MYSRDIVIMAKSNKHGEYCIAGIDINTFEWIRPVSNLTDIERAVPREHVVYKDGEEIQLLDVVRISFIEALPTEAQSENILYDDTIYWEKIDSWSLVYLLQLIMPQNLDYIFVNAQKALYENELTGKSLAFVKIDNPRILVKNFDNRNKATLLFEYKGNEYKFIAISDPCVLKEYIDKPEGVYYIGASSYAVFSLTNKYQQDGKYYKMLATLFM
ncbi:MAG: hypothetical protein IJJ61_05575 [Clostridia bacterium]|nr:hypothetical protein [Clostridia bacterium]MBQ6467396.1 hypothetical protein [Clostridia bacterium]